MRIAHIIPIIRLPRGMNFFDYTVPHELAQEVHPGSFVVIPFRSSTVPGLVVECKNGDGKNCKPISTLLPLAYSEWEKQISFFSWFASEYYVSQATVLKTLLPTFPKSFLSGKKVRSRSDTISPPHEYGALNISPPTLPSFEENTHVTQLHASTLQEKWFLYLSLINTSLSHQKRALVIFPTIHDAELFTSTASSALHPHRTLLFHSGISQGMLFRRWQELFSSDPMCIIGTRTALCAPLQSIDTIIVDQTERSDHIQSDMNPRFDSRRAVKHIGQSTGAKIFYWSSAPRIDEHAAIHPHKKNLPSTPCINLHDEFRKGSRTLFVTEQLIRAIQECLSKRRSVFLYCNRTGSGRMAICSECGYIYSCPCCHTPLKPFAHPPTLACNACVASIPMGAHCPECRSVDIKLVGLGIEKIIQSLEGYFPTVPILEISSKQSETPFIKSLHVTKEREALATTPSITIGTSYALSACPEIFSTVGLVAVITADPFLLLNDFRALERQWQTLAQLRFFARSFHAEMLIQAFDTSSHFIQTFIRDDYESFSDAEREQRKKSDWPPYTKSIHLLYKPARHVPAPEQRKAINEVVGYFSSPAKDPRCSLSVHRPLHEKNKSSVYEVVIRISQHDNSDEIPQSLQEYLRHLPNDWLVDREPLFF